MRWNLWILRLPQTQLMMSSWLVSSMFAGCGATCPVVPRSGLNCAAVERQRDWFVAIKEVIPGKYRTFNSLGPCSLHLGTINVCDEQRRFRVGLIKNMSLGIHDDAPSHTDRSSGVHAECVELIRDGVGASHNELLFTVRRGGLDDVDHCVDP